MVEPESDLDRALRLSASIELEALRQMEGWINERKLRETAEAERDALKQRVEELEAGLLKCREYAAGWASKGTDLRDFEAIKKVAHGALGPEFFERRARTLLQNGEGG